jgi:UDP-glucose 4-epimerase
VTALVTGGAGFIGSHLVEHLVRRDEKVVVIDDLSTGRRENIAGLGDDLAELTVGSVLNAGLVEQLIAGASVVYHLAAVVGVDRVCRDPALALRVNIEGTRVVLDACARHGVTAVIASTSEVYGKNRDVPLSEDAQTILGPTSVPRWSYAVSKLADEHLARAVDGGIPVVLLRYFNSYGPRLDLLGYGSVTARFIGQALQGLPMTIYGDGRQTRSFTYVEDTIAATVAAAELGAGGVYNIGSDREISINDLADAVRQVAGSSSKIIHRPPPSAWGPFDEPRRRLPDTSLARQRLDWRPRVDLIEGLGRTVAWMRPRLDQIGLKESA